jgi:excisionase family DNA binding protein
MSSPDAAFDLLTITEVADVLHCSKAHVCNLVAGRVLGCKPMPAVRLGRRMLVRRGSLLTWIEQNDKIAVSPESKVRKSA